VSAATADGPRQLPLEASHLARGATLAPFAGWAMPVRYASDLAEHHAVRRTAGLFDVSHMGQLELHGADAALALEQALVSRVTDLRPGRARYTMLCDEAGEVVDDLIVSHLAGHHLVVANAANAAAVASALAAACAGLDARLVPRPDRVLLALQGPRAVRVLAAAGAAEAGALRPFAVTTLVVAGVDTLVSRTGYTGEDGFELAADAADAVALWDGLLAAGGELELMPCGLAARDTLRLEAGLPLHGHELGGGLGPFEIGFGRVVHLDRDTGFPGRDVLARVAADGPTRRVVGLRTTGRRAPRAGYAVHLPDGGRIGTVTSGAPSPTLGVPIALAAVPSAHATSGTALAVDVRGELVAAEVVDLPFVPRGRPEGATA